MVTAGLPDSYLEKRTAIDETDLAYVDRRCLSGVFVGDSDADDLEETHSRYALVVSTRSQRLSPYGLSR
ncbi:hypothetical protein EL22_21005 [Halostagnicola sp. A56]|uniref:hypothetical protein n=1 Tax=Halostagnicola sp. A56 TaxID=1495067 RepID=UPI0004A081E5|nr:hypothetical protein [Halostagnicola sp. A56]KDE60502.1 hypothetical protein EL22_21005 [Halostagnicola sp. A56]